MTNEYITELSEFVSQLTFSKTYSGGAYPDMELSYTVERLIDLEVYELNGYASVEQKCNDKLLPEFESHLKTITRNIDDSVISEIHNLPRIISEIVKIKESIFSYDGNYTGEKKYAEPFQIIGKVENNAIEYAKVDRNEIIQFYQCELFNEVRLIAVENNKFKPNNIKIDYHINATEEQYINCLQYLLDSLISSLENKKYMYTSVPQTQIVTNTEKIQWIESDLLLGYLINRLENSEMIILPKIDTDKLDLKKSAKLLFNAFKFKDRKNISPSEEAIEKAISGRYVNRLNQSNVEKVDRLINELRLLMIDLQ